MSTPVEPIVMPSLERRTTWNIQPAEGETFECGDKLLPMVEFPVQVRELRLRREGEYHVSAYIRGDGAHVMRTEFETPLPPLYVVEVCELSGWLRGRIPCRWCGGEGAIDSGGVTPWGQEIDVPCSECD